jgi:predicted RNA-binding Zn ribbon-like protein
METPETIKLLGGRLCLHFANTVDRSDTGEPLPATDALTEPDALERWAHRLRLDEPGAEPLPRAGWGPAASPPAAAAASPPELAAARELRAALYLLFSSLAADRTPPPDALETLHAVHAEGVAAAHLAAHPDGAYALAWPPDEPRRVRYAVAADAVALLGDAVALARLHQCPGRNCGWFFLNTSGRQRWCSMASCGSRAKMRRMYARRRAA